MLRGRADEIGRIGEFLRDARAGASGVLVVRGEAGIGKTALLDEAAMAAHDTGMMVLRGVGVESEAELPFAGLHLLLRPVLDRVARLPERQAAALHGAFGLAEAAGSGDRFLTGLAVLSLLSELAEQEPLLCVVDDVQWLDRASREALLFAARRLGAEGVALLLGVREGTLPLSGLPELVLTGLAHEASVAVLADHAAGLSAEQRFRVLAAAHGNPLALRELPAVLATGAFPAAGGVAGAFLGQIARLPEATQTALLTAATDDTGQLDVVLRAVARLGGSAADFEPAERAGLIQLSEGRLAFRHPLVRAAVYPGLPLSRRLAVHAALAAVLEAPEDADRRAWHQAAAVTGPDETTAQQLERTAERAGNRLGHAAASAAYKRAARLSPPGPAQDRRQLLAAEASAEAGDLEEAGRLVERITALDAEPAVQARLIHVRANTYFAAGRLHEATTLLLEGADLVSRTDPSRALRLLMECVHTCWYACDPELTATVAGRLERLRLGETHPLEPIRHLLLWTVGQAIGYREGLPPLPEVVAACRAATTTTHRDLMMVCACSVVTGQDGQTRELAGILVEEGRLTGRIGWLPPALTYLAQAQLLHGLHHDARASAEEVQRIADATGQPHWIMPTVLAYLAAVEGDQDLCRELADETLPISRGRPWTQWALGLLDLGKGRPEAALARFEALSRGPAYYHLATTRSTPDQVEAAVRLGQGERASAAMARFTDWARHAQQPGIDALAARCRALLAVDDQAEEHYRTALDLHDRSGRPFEHARTRLLYGEWLRRARRKSEARLQFTGALATFERLATTPWAERARTELVATGLSAPRRTGASPRSTLTPQELQIARLAAQGLSNKDIAAQLFLSPRTVGHHLYKTYPKLGVTARTELDLAALE